jgi:hypothetical protein
MSNYEHSLPIQSYNPEADLQLAIQLILKAFEKKTTISDKESMNMNEQIRRKDSKIEELHNAVNSLAKEIKNLREENSRLKEENSYLLDMTRNLNDNNDKLQNFKFTILNSIETEPSALKISKLQIANLIDSRSKKCSPSRDRKDTHEFRETKDNRDNREIRADKNSNYVNNQNTTSSFVKEGGEGNSISPRSNYTHTSNIDELLGKLNTKIFTQHTGGYSSEEENFVSNSSVRNGYNSNFNKRISDMKFKLKIQNNSHSSIPLRHKEENDRNERNESNNYVSQARKYEGKSNQYILASKFFSECRITLKKESYEDLVSSIKEKGDNNFDADQVYYRVQEILRGHPRLLKDFHSIFPYLNKK